MKSVCLAFTLLATLPAWAGPSSSGGGGAAVCRDANHNITSAHMLDLYEGENRFGYTIPSSLESPRAQVLEAIAKLPTAKHRQLALLIAAKVVHSIQFLPPGVGLSPTTDVGTDYGVVVPDGCEIEPVGFYEYDGTLKVSRAVYTALSLTDRAAFIVHETLYKIARDELEAKDSADARHLTAAVFSTAKADDIADKAANVLIPDETPWDIITTSADKGNFTFTFTPSSTDNYSATVNCDTVFYDPPGASGFFSGSATPLKSGPDTESPVTGRCGFFEVIAKNQYWYLKQSINVTVTQQGTKVLDRTLTSDQVMGGTYFLVVTEQMDLPEIPTL